MPSLDTRRKFLPPILPEVFCPRPELMKVYDRVQAGRYIFVSAPAGYGKSVSTLIWLARSGRRTIWIQLDKFDDNPYAFYRLLGQALLSVQPDNAEIRDILSDRAFQANPVDKALELFSRFRPDGREYVIVLDDFHTITNPEILRSLIYVNRRLPATCTAAILSRNEPAGIFLSEVTSMGAVSITAKDLAFSPREIRDYLALIGETASAAEIAEIHRLSGGWAIGIFVLTGAADCRQEAAERGLKLIEHYFRCQVWDNCDEGTRRFILLASISDEWPADLCRLLTGEAETGQIQEDLYQRCFFLSKTGDGVYHCHHLILQVIRDLPEYKALVTSGHYRIVAEYYHQRNLLSKACHYAIMSGDMEAIARFGFPSIHQSAQAFEDQKYPANYLPLDSVTEETCQKHPFLYILKLWVALMESSADRFCYFLDKMYESSAEVIRRYPRFAYMYHYFFSMEPRKLYHEVCQYSHDNLPPTVFTREDQLNIITYTFQMPFIHRGGRDCHDVANQGRLSDCLEVIGDAFSDGNNNSFFPAMQAGLLLEKNQIEEAQEAALTAVSLLNNQTIHEVRFSTYMHLAAVYDARGNQTELAAVLNETERYIKRDYQFLLPNFSAFKTRLKIYDGNGPAAEAWLKASYVHKGPTLKVFEIYQYFTTTRALILLGRLEEGRVLLTLLRKLVTGFNRFLDMAEVDVLEAILLWMTGHRPRAVDLLEAVLRRLEGGGFIKVVADEGAAVLPILNAVMVKNEGLEALDRIDRQYLSRLFFAAHLKSKRCPGITSQLKVKLKKLSKQQKYILTLLAEGLKNSEIVRLTGLSLNTVKAHTREAYAKLEVNNVADAVNKATTLGLI